MTSGTTFFICSTKWVCRCSRAAISAIFLLIRSESRAPCQREVKKPKIQIKYVNITPKTNSLTFWPKEVSQEMNGITFFVCSILWIFRCILVVILATFFRVPCRKVVRRRIRKKALQRRKHSQVWCCASKRVTKSHPGNADERKEVVRATRQQVVPDSKSKIGYSQASRQENVPQATWKLVPPGSKPF